MVARSRGRGFTAEARHGGQPQRGAAGFWGVVSCANGESRAGREGSGTREAAEFYDGAAGGKY